jgi:integrase/recombinase XerD
VNAAVVDEELAGDEKEFSDLVELWLETRAKSEHTKTAYRTDSDLWMSWCSAHGVDPMKAEKTDVERWHRQLAETPTRNRRPPARATLARRVSSVASLYDFLVEEDYVDKVPIRSSTRPRAEKESSTTGLSAEETVQLQGQATESGIRDEAIITILLVLGLRVAELTGLRVRHYRWQKGHRVLRVVGKGDKMRELIVQGPARKVLERWLAELAAKLGVDVDALDGDQLLFPSVAGGQLSQQSVMRTVQRLAKAAGIPSWSKISPHSLRHTCATIMLDAGVPINVVQVQLGHGDISTTLRYDRARESISRKLKGTGDYQAYLQQVATNMREAGS